MESSLSLSLETALEINPKLVWLRKLHPDNQAQGVSNTNVTQVENFIFIPLLKVYIISFQKN